MADYYVNTSMIAPKEDESESGYKKFKRIETKMYMEFNKNGSILADFYDYSKDSLEMNSDIGIPEYLFMANVNPNYLMNEKLRDDKGNIISVDENCTKKVYIIPEKYKKIEDEVRKELVSCFDDEKKDYDLIWLKDDSECFTYNLEIELENGNKVRNPSLNVITESNGVPSDYSRICGYQGNPFKIKKIDGMNPFEYINSVTRKYLDPKKYDLVFENAGEKVFAQIEFTRKFVRLLFGGLIGVLILLIVLVYQNTINYIQNNKRLISIQCLLGFGLLRTYKRQLLKIVITWLVLCGFTFAIIKDVNLIPVMGFGVILELMGVLFVIIRLQQKSIVQAIKGE